MMMMMVDLTECPPFIRSITNRKSSKSKKKACSAKFPFELFINNNKNNNAFPTGIVLSFFLVSFIYKSFGERRTVFFFNHTNPGLAT